jgi:hypothetical protein
VTGTGARPDGHRPPRSDAPPAPPAGPADGPLPAIAFDPDDTRRRIRLAAATRAAGAREFTRRADGMIHAMDGGIWLHRHVWLGRPMAHVVSTDRDRLLRYGDALGLPHERLQFKPLRDPRTRERRDAWHWDLGGPVLPPPDDALQAD